MGQGQLQVLELLENGGSQNLPVEVSEGLIWCWELIRGVTSRGER